MNVNLTGMFGYFFKFIESCNKNGMETRRLETAEDGLRNLLEGYEDFLQDPLSERKARILAVEAWHLHDWVRPANVSLTDYRKELISLCPELGIMHDIATKTKHAKISSPKSNARSLDYTRGFSMEFSAAFVKSSIDIHLEDGTVVFFKDVIKKVIDF